MKPNIQVRTTCPYCGVGCGILASSRKDGSVAIEGDPNHPANFGRLCSKGSTLGETMGLEGRLLSPRVDGQESEWDFALDRVAEKFSEAIREHGPDSVAFYISGQLLTEDYYVANKLMKGFIGSANIDTNSRLCMASSVAGHKRAFGSDTVPGNYEDLELADLVILVGSNLAWCHPVLFQRVNAAREKRNGLPRLVVIDPRRTVTAEEADLHLPVKPDGDVALFNGLLGYLAENRLLDDAYISRSTEGYESAMEAVGELSSVELQRQTGLGADQLNRFFALFGKHNKAVTVYSQGVNQSTTGSNKVNAIINCHLATGRIGRPGMGPFSVTGQPNAMGGREVGGLANMLVAHMDIEREDHRELAKTFWQSPLIAQKPGLKAVDMFRAVAAGRIKALWIMATNPADSMPDAGGVEHAIAGCPFVAVSDIVDSNDTLRHADVLLPSMGWGEKSGTVTNSERRISRQRAFVSAPGGAKPDWWQIVQVAGKMGFETAFDYTDAVDIFREYAALSAYKNNGQRDFDIGALADITGGDYDAMAPCQWPVTETSPTTSRFFGNGKFYTESNKARFIATPSTDCGRTDSRYPFTLNTGRVRDHWHTMTRTARSARLGAHLAEPFCEIHPGDARNLGIADNDLVKVQDNQGEIIVRAMVTDRVQRGMTFVPMHWTDQYSANARVDRLVKSDTDPVSGQPGFKNTPVRLRKYGAKLYGFAICRSRPQTVHAPYWVCAKCEGGYRLEFALAGGTNDINLENIVGYKAATASLSYVDSSNGVQRYAWYDNDALQCMVYLGSDPVTVSRSWIADQLNRQSTSANERLGLLAGIMPANLPDPGSIVCSCFSVGENDIRKAVKSGCKTVDDLGKQLNAGTNCGSCRPELAAFL